MSKDIRTTQDGYYLGPWAVQRLNDRHGWFEHADAQSHVSRAFANNAIHAFIESAKEAQRVEDEAGLTPKQILEQRNELLEALQALDDIGCFQHGMLGNQPSILQAVEKATTAIAKATS